MWNGQTRSTGCPSFAAIMPGGCQFLQHGIRSQWRLARMHCQSRLLATSTAQIKHQAPAGTPNLFPTD